MVTYLIPPVKILSVQLIPPIQEAFSKNTILQINTKNLD